MLRQFFIGAKIQARRTFAAPKYVFMLFLLLGISYLTMEIYSNLVVQNQPVAIIDFDNSSVSRTLRRIIAANREISVTNIPINSVEEAKGLIERGEIAALVLIPHDFSSQIKKGKKGDVVVAIDMSNILIGKNVMKALTASVTAVSAGVQITTLKKLGDRKNAAMAHAMPVIVSENNTHNPASNYAIYIIPGAIFFFLNVYILILAATALLPEERLRSFRRLAGSYLVIFITGFAIGMLFFYVYLPHESIYPQSRFSIIAFTLSAFIVIDLMSAVVLTMIIPARLLAFQTTIILAMLSLMFSGITWPTDMFPPAIREFSMWMPFTPFAKAFQLFLHYPTEWDSLAYVYSVMTRQAELFALIIAVMFILKRIFRRLFPQAAKFFKKEEEAEAADVIASEGDAEDEPVEETADSGALPAEPISKPEAGR